MPLGFISKFLVCSVLMFHGANAAEFDVLDGVAPGQKAIMIRGPIEPGDDETFYKLSQQAERASVFLESPGGNVDTGLSIGARVSM